MTDEEAARLYALGDDLAHMITLDRAQWLRLASEALLAVGRQDAADLLQKAYKEAIARWEQADTDVADALAQEQRALLRKGEGGKKEKKGKKKTG